MIDKRNVALTLALVLFPYLFLLGVATILLMLSS